MWVQYKVFYVVTAVRSVTQVLHKAEKFGLNGSLQSDLTLSSGIRCSLSKFTEKRERKVTVFSLFYRNRKWYHPDRYFHDWTKKLTENNFSFRVSYQAFRRNWMCSETKLFINSVFSELWFQGKIIYEYSHFTLTAGSCTVGPVRQQINNP